jgi:hypothetical protein
MMVYIYIYIYIYIIGNYRFGMTKTSIVSHGPGAPATGPMCYGGAEEDTASKACITK